SAACACRGASVRGNHGAVPQPPLAAAPIEAVVFDLFDTLVDLDFGHLPLVDLDGRSVRSTYADLHASLGPSLELDFAAFSEALLAVDREIGEIVRRDGREVSTRDRFGRFAARVGAVDVELAERMARVHMGRIREGATAPAPHADVLARLRGRYRIGICSNFSDAETALAI